MATTSKERVRATFSGLHADRVPINYLANPGVDRRVKEYFGLKPDDTEGLLQILGVDFRVVNADYAGPEIHSDICEQGIKVNEWGIHKRWITHETGGYWDFCTFPLRDASEEQVAEWPMPSPDDYDYSHIHEMCSRHEQYAVCCYGGMGDIINGNGMLRGMEQTLIDLITDDPAGLLLADRRIEIQTEVTRRCLEAAKGKADFIWLGEDLGTQIGPIISMEVFRKHIRPRLQHLCDLAKAYDVFVMMHTCGSSSWAYNDFVEMGIHIVDALQPEAKNMSPEYLKKTFGGRLAFHGCISTAGVLATGSSEQVAEYCRNTLDIMMPGGGYCFAPTHLMQDNTPTENVIMLYEIAKKHGVY